MSSSFREIDNQAAEPKASRIRARRAEQAERAREQEHEWVSSLAVAEPKRTWEPDAMECFIGGFFGDSFRVRFRDGKLVHTAYGPGYEPRETVVIAPSPTRWEEFWHELDQVGVWGWELKYGEYRGDHSTVYEIKIEHAGLALRTSGADAFPPLNRRLDESDQFMRFCSAIRKLAGWRSFR
jgi:hypothetical protein